MSAVVSFSIGTPIVHPTASAVPIGRHREQIVFPSELARHDAGIEFPDHAEPNGSYSLPRIARNLNLTLGDGRFCQIHIRMENLVSVAGQKGECTGERFRLAARAEVQLQSKPLG